MSTQSDDNQGVVWAVLIGVILLAISMAVGIGLYRTSQGAAAPTVAAPAGASAAAAPVPEGASVRVDNGMVTFYFASASAELADGAADALADVVKGVAAGQRAVISGYHDVTGDPAQNEELAKQRAFAVRDALLALGIGEDKLDLSKPAVTAASGSLAEARRVEVTLQ